MRNDAAGVAAALSAGAAVDGIYCGQTVLRWALSAVGTAKCVRLLLAAGADPELRDRYSRCAIHEAALYGDAECIAALLEAGADPLAAATDGKTALHFAVGKRRLPAMLALFQAAPEAAMMRDGKGEAPLEEAIISLRLGPRSPCFADKMAFARQLLEELRIEARDTDRLLAALVRSHKTVGGWVQPLFPLLTAQQPLTAAQILIRESSLVARQLRRQQAESLRLALYT